VPSADQVDQRSQMRALTAGGTSCQRPVRAVPALRRYVVACHATPLRFSACTLMAGLALGLSEAAATATSAAAARGVAETPTL
jgi:hypothetical protein